MKYSAIVAISAFVMASTCTIPVHGAQSDTLKTSELLSSLTHLDNYKFEQLLIVTKTWEETFDGNRGFEIRFFTPSTNSKSSSDFWSSIPIYDDETLFHLKDWRSADCSLMQSIVSSKRNHVFLWVASRYHSVHDLNPWPQDQPEIQKVTEFELIENSNGLPGRPALYFQNTHKTKSVRAVCTEEEVNNMLVESAAGK